MAREMKDSRIAWLGEIPRGWSIIKAKYVASITNGSDPKSEGDIPVYGSGDASFKTCGEYKEGPTVLLGRKGATLHIPHYIEGKYWNVDTAFDVKTNPLNFNLRFFYYLAICFDYKCFISQTTLPGMTQTNYKNMIIPFPTLEEQINIVQFLDAKCIEIDDLFDQIHESIEEYKRLKQAVITQAVTKGVRGNRPMKESGIEWADAIPEEIKVSRLGLHYNIILGKMLCSAQVDGTYTLEPYYCAADVHFEGISNSERKMMWFSPDEKELYIVKKDDLLVVEGGAGAGGCAIVTDEETSAYIQNSIMIVRAKHSGNCRYVRYWLECLVRQGYIDVVCNKATIPHFTKDKLAAVPYFTFSEYERNEIADYLDEQCEKINAQVEKKECLLHELESYKRSLIYEYATGKKEVI